MSRVQEARKKRSFPAAGSEKARGVWAFARAHPRNSNLAVLYLDSESSSCRGARSCGAAAAADDQQVGGPRAQHYVWLLYAVLLLLSDVTVYFEDDGAEQADDDVGLQKHAIQAVDQLEVVLRIVRQLHRGGVVATATGSTSVAEGPPSCTSSSAVALAAGGGEMNDARSAKKTSFLCCSASGAKPPNLSSKAIATLESAFKVWHNFASGGRGHELIYNRCAQYRKTE